jgi:3-hydroxymyristoyl/3-hydroxydecanoyl-(acyl carrier protein) dehydratase
MSLELMPHKAPMLWVNKVTEVNQSGGRVIVEANESSLFWDLDECGNLRIMWSAPCEWVAQAMLACVCTHTGNRPHLIFLAGIDSIRWHQDYDSLKFDSAKHNFSVEVSMDRRVGPVSFFSGKVFLENSKTPFFETKLKSFTLDPMEENKSQSTGKPVMGDKTGIFWRGNLHEKRFELPSNSVFLDGHFNEYPVYPGILLSQMAAEIFKSVKGRWPLDIKVKFAGPVLPSALVTVTETEYVSKTLLEIFEGDEKLVTATLT